MGRIECNGLEAKAAREVHAGDRLKVRTEHNDFEVEVLLLSAIRGPASVAQMLYRETDASRELRFKLAQERKSMINVAPAPVGRPSKRDRRKIIQFRNRQNSD